MIKKNLLSKLLIFRNDLRICELRGYRGDYNFNELLIMLGTLSDDFDDIISFIEDLK